MRRRWSSLWLLNTLATAYLILVFLAHVTDADRLMYSVREDWAKMEVVTALSFLLMLLYSWKWRRPSMAVLPTLILILHFVQLGLGLWPSSSWVDALPLSSPVTSMGFVLMVAAIMPVRFKSWSWFSFGLLGFVYLCCGLILAFYLVLSFIR